MSAGDDYAIRRGRILVERKDRDLAYLRRCDTPDGAVLDATLAGDWGALETFGLIAHVGVWRYRTTDAGRVVLANGHPNPERVRRES